MARTIVITGCSSGFGRATALHLAQHGWHVFATVLKEADMAELRDQAVQFGCADYLVPMLCDITKPEQVMGLSENVARATPGLDALLNNAGTAFPGPLELLTLPNLRAQLEINLIGHLAVTQSFLPMLKAARGIVINVSSVCGRIALPAIGAYVVSKFGLEALSDVLRLELAPFGVRVVVLRPSAGATAIYETSAKRTAALLQASAENPYKPLLISVERFFGHAATHGFPAELFAHKVRKILSVARPRACYAVPTWTGLLVLLRNCLPNRIWDWLIRRNLRY